MSPQLQDHFFRLFSHLLYIMGIFLMLSLGSIVAHAQLAETSLASKTISLDERYPIQSVSAIFKDNILLAAAYMADKQQKTASPAWNQIEQPFTYEFSLKPGEIFAFHDETLPEYRRNVVKTTNAHFNSSEGFKSDGFLIGDGVCHLASLFYWASKDAGLEAVAPVNHDFAAIPQIDKKYGVAIYADPSNATVSEQQNLYIRNNKSEPITFRMNYDGKDLTVEVLKQS